MRGARSGPGSHDWRARFDEESRLTPEWRPWLRLVELAVGAAEEPSWAAALPRVAAARPSGAPVLDGAVAVLDPLPATRWVDRLLRAASELAGAGRGERAASLTGAVDALALLEAAIRQETERVASVAAAAGAPPDSLAVVAQLAAAPLLQAWAARLADRSPSAWNQGYCPVCGAWPALAELRGLERERRLRCGRCGSEWVIPLLHCPYCHETDHERLGSLVAEGEEQTRRADTCRTCGGYVKTFSRLAATPIWELPLEDLRSVDLDVAAAERGYARPARPGYAVAFRLLPSSGPLADLLEPAP